MTHIIHVPEQTAKWAAMRTDAINVLTWALPSCDESEILKFENNIYMSITCQSGFHQKTYYFVEFYRNFIQEFLKACNETQQKVFNMFVDKCQKIKLDLDH